MNPNKVHSILACPVCRKKLLFRHQAVFCSHCRRKYPIQSGIICFSRLFSREAHAQAQIWDKTYETWKEKQEYHKQAALYRRLYFSDTYRQFEAEKSMSNTVYLEIGCGPMFFGTFAAGKCRLVIGIDISFQGLLLAKKMMMQSGITNFLLIQADIVNIPLVENSVDSIYGGGVLDHVRDVGEAVSECYRVLSTGGLLFNTVPYLNIGALTYRQFYGSVPDIPIIDRIIEYIHTKVLKRKHGRFGFERTFTMRKIRHIYEQAGFTHCSIGKFDAELLFEYLPLCTRGIATWLANTFQLFWPMIKVSAIK
jgi:ubiquinone/menaquinone biosynthesis C-methylase UbiE/uncharacterized protein YbaR (Trm112 family)